MTLSLLAACSGISVLNTLNNASGYRDRQDIAYGDHPRHKLDIYRPRENDRQCLVVFAYGGSWEEGRKGDYGFVGAALARRGYTVVIPDYRLYPEVRFPAFVEDFALALASEPVQALAASRRLVLMGHSAGAMLAGLVSYDSRYLQAVGLSRDNIDGYITLAGPHDYFLPTDKDRWTRIFGEDKGRQVDALTVNHIHPDNPPTLILHGGNDDIVTPRSADSLAGKLTRAGVANTRKVYAGVNHIRIAAAMGRPLGFLAPTLDDVEQFLQKRCAQVK